jgi:hypothetical protein
MSGLIGHAGKNTLLMRGIGEYLTARPIRKQKRISRAGAVTVRASLATRRSSETTAEISSGIPFRRYGDLKKTKEF